MKKTLKINLGGIAFNIDEDAFTLLDSYLKSIKQHLGNTAEASEVIYDIEERASELLLGMVKENESVNIDMVNRVMETLGKPEQIAGEPENQYDDDTESSSSKIKKKLYRDPDNAVAAGVAGGLGAYFKVDPIIFRILFVALFFAQGIGLIAYIILWVAVPRAESPRQKLEMRGEAVNLENLEKNIRKEYEEVKKNLNKQGVPQAAEKGVSMLGRFFEVFAKVIGAIVGAVLIGVALIALIGTILSIFLGGLAIATIFPNFTGVSLAEIFGSTIDFGSYAWVSIPVFLIIAIPLISLIYLGIRILFKFRSTDGVYGSIAATVWILSVVTLAVVMFLQARSFTIREAVTENITLIPAQPNTKTLVLTAQESDRESVVFSKESINIDDYSIAIADGNVNVFGRPRISIGKSTGNDFELIIERKARGATRNNAKLNAQSINLSYTFSDSTLTISPQFSLPQGEKWRMQEILVTVNIPEGKRIFIDKNMEYILSSTQDFCFCWPDELVGKVWVMRKDRMVEY